MGWLSLQSGVTQRDLNVKEAWAQGFTGHGIVVSILDDGIEKNHPDLAGNYVRAGKEWWESPGQGPRGNCPVLSCQRGEAAPNEGRVLPRTLEPVLT